ncbi:hypothetical protein [Bacillus thuringiensis]|uniref:hypothetical protein n=1 Tax=Bacillus thuringiensis TaxID=1428 RepID=UPI000BFC46CA|nr:hypothetical protein [Bacillus thuringiensis]PGT90020.1 hypothetical protein COD17_09730 [Bacillus thuringiensis]
MARKYNYKVVAWLYGAGYSQKEVGYMLGISAGYVGTILSTEKVRTRKDSRESRRTLVENFPAIVTDYMTREEVARAKELSDYYKKKYIQNIDKPRDIHSVALSLLQDWVGNTALNGLKVQNPKLEIKRSEKQFSTVSAYVKYTDSKTFFDWYEDEESDDVGVYALMVDERNCPKFLAIQQYGKKREQEWNGKNPRILASYEIDGEQGRVTLAVRLRFVGTNPQG